MIKNKIKTFIENYSRNDFGKIKFDWNGKHGDDFKDNNYDFRMRVCETIKDDFSTLLTK